MPTQVEVVQGSLTSGSELVLVNASNTGVMLGSGVSGAIAQACGEGYQERIRDELQSKRGGVLPPGDVLVTGAGAHPTAKWIAHVAVMDYRPGAEQKGPTLDRIRTGCERLWDAIEQIDAPEPLSVAMVALGAGVGRIDLRDSTRIACETLKAHGAIHTKTRIGKVVFYGYKPQEFTAMREVVAAHFPSAA